MEEFCELCGRKTNLMDAIVEGSMLSVCKNCAKFGNVIEIKKPRFIEEKEITGRKFLKVEEPEEIIVSDYAERIKKGRENYHLKQAQLANRIAERESVIHRIESGQMQPSFTLAKKLERFLKIKLIQTYTEPEQSRINLGDKELTIGDLLKVKKDRNL